MVYLTQCMEIKNMLEEFSALEQKVQRLIKEYGILKVKDDHYLKLLQEKEAELNLFIEEQESLKKENENLKNLIKDANDREEHIKAKLYSVSKILDSFDHSSLEKTKEIEVKEAPIVQNNNSHVVQEEKHKIVKAHVEQKLEITPSTEEDLIDLNDSREDPFTSANDKDWDNSIEEEKVPLPTEEKVPLPTEEKVPLPTEESVPVPTEESVPVPTEESVPVPTEESMPVPTEESMPVPTEEGNSYDDEYMLDTEDDEFHFGLENEKS